MSIWGRKGHARAAILTIIPEEMQAAVEEFDATENLVGTGYQIVPGSFDADKRITPLVVLQSIDRGNGPTQASAQNVIEDWRPEFLILCGIAGGILRPKGPESRRTLEGPRVGDIVIGTYIHHAEYNKMVDGDIRARYSPSTPPSTTAVADYCRPLGLNGGWLTDALRDRRPGRSLPQFHDGEVVAVDGVMGDASNEHHAAIIKRYDKALAADMESQGVATALQVLGGNVRYNPRWICVRSISDEVVTGTEAEALLAADPHEVRDQWRMPAARTAAAFAHALVQNLLRDELPASAADWECPAYVPRASAPSGRLTT